MRGLPPRGVAPHALAQVAAFPDVILRCSVFLETQLGASKMKIEEA
jgi:hypothetical protein